MKQKLAFLGFSPSLRSILAAHNGSALRCFRTLKTEQCDLLASRLHSFLLSRFICSRRSVSLHLGLTPESYDPWSSSSLRSNLAAHDDSTLLCRSSPRLISIGQLHASQRFHLRPINDIVYVEPYSIKDERSNLRGSFTLRCLQRLSRPYVATQLCPWQDNWCTRGMSIPVLSY